MVSARNFSDFIKSGVEFLLSDWTPFIRTANSDMLERTNLLLSWNFKQSFGRPSSDFNGSFKHVDTWHGLL